MAWFDGGRLNANVFFYGFFLQVAGADAGEMDGCHKDERRHGSKTFTESCERKRISLLKFGKAFKKVGWDGRGGSSIGFV